MKNLLASAGKFFDSIIGDLEASKRAETSCVHHSGALLEIHLSRLAPDPDQPRKQFDQASLEALAATIKEKGLLQPLRVRPAALADQWILVLGERRFRAAKLAGLSSLPCVCATDNVSPEQILEEQLIDDLFRSDLNPIERASALQTLMARKGLDGAGLAGKLHLPPSLVCRTVALLELPADVQDLVAGGRIAARSAYELCKLSSAREQRSMAKKVLERKLSTAATALAVRLKRGKLPCGNSGQESGVRSQESGARGQESGVTVRYPWPEGTVAITIPQGQPAGAAAELALLAKTAQRVQLRLDNLTPPEAA